MTGHRDEMPIGWHLGDVVASTVIYNIISWKCPVDIDIYDINGSLIARIIDNQPHFVNGSEDELLLHAIGDLKVLVSNRNKQYTFIINATDSGIMNYSITSIDGSTGGVSLVKSFNNVPLTPGRQMTSIIGGSVEVNAIRLLISNNGQAIGEIFEDGTYVVFSQPQPSPEATTRISPKTDDPNNALLMVLLSIGPVCLAGAEVYRRRRKKASGK